MNQKQPKKSGVLLWVLIAAAAVCIAAVLLWPSRPDTPVEPSRETTAPAVQTVPVGTEPVRTEPALTEPAATEPETTGPDEGVPEETEPEETEPREEEQPTIPVQQTINLGCGLEIIDAGSYTGAYVEDGSGQIVSGVMMIVVRNTGEQDVQLADIVAVSGGSEYTFRLTNLAVGERVVLLDLERRQASEAVLDSAIVSEVALFETPMELHGGTIQIDGLNGMLNVKNISEKDISGDIYIYYKFAATDIFYGGITFRVRVEGGLKAGELRQIPAGHFTPGECRIIQVSIYE